MPKYDYVCSKCGNIEIEKSMNSPHPTVCPNCGTNDLRRIFSAQSFQILGEHYVTSRIKATPQAGTIIQPRSA